MKKGKKANSGQDIRLQFEGNLEFISRRIFPRVDVNAWVGVKRQQGNLSIMRALWDEHVKKIKSGVSAAELTEFKKFLVNLAGGGMRLPLEPPVEMADLVMIYLSIGDKKGSSIRFLQWCVHRLLSTTATD